MLHLKPAHRTQNIHFISRYNFFFFFQSRFSIVQSTLLLSILMSIPFFSTSSFSSSSVFLVYILKSFQRIWLESCFFPYFFNSSSLNGQNTLHLNPRALISGQKWIDFGASDVKHVIENSALGWKIWMHWLRLCDSSYDECHQRKRMDKMVKRNKTLMNVSVTIFGLECDSKYSQMKS